jgi:hypothetical protein
MNKEVAHLLLTFRGYSVKWFTIISTSSPTGTMSAFQILRLKLQKRTIFEA